MKAPAWDTDFGSPFRRPGPAGNGQCPTRRSAWVGKAQEPCTALGASAPHRLQMAGPLIVPNFL